MYDIHNHVLPGVDDGSKGLRMSLRMLEQAIHSGITHVACTPHANDRSGSAADALFRETFDVLQAEVRQRDLPVTLGLAAEIMFGAELKNTLEYSFATYNSHGEYFLIEFPRETPFEIILNVIRVSRRWGKRPVIAHFERYRAACKRPEQPREIQAEGGIITLDAGSLVGQFGKDMLRNSKQLLEWDSVDILASDAHNEDNYPFILKEGREAAAKITSQVAAEKMTVEHPAIIWDGRPWPRNIKPDTSAA